MSSEKNSIPTFPPHPSLPPLPPLPPGARIHYGSPPPGIKPMTIRRKLVKITMEYDDGDKQMLEGKDAQDWQEEYHMLMTNLILHHGIPSSFPWKVVPK